ncbi:ribonuclease HII [Geobacter sp. SVR]|uniref:ribonuclease HII n=1 Tax=Geobacter sp. SVR TaxID=2495594 RepID=UPI00143F0213|nr:ribonuclease HII [Geobacter sp. SVR]BCS53163.1 ribonuclease HII [Geobacter sp. SVR]GCF84548.1 ribonuclease HII [Geobacter sp. SVR]
MTQPELFASPPFDILTFEQQAQRRGYRAIAGIDEAGRGPLAGPVVAAAVILPEGLRLAEVDDSKKLTPETRERLFDLVMEQASAVGIGIVGPEVIDRINILQATRQAMLEAVTQLSPIPDFLLIDGISTIEAPIPQKTVKKGDSLSLSIAAASIIAKVTRDRLMCELDLHYPGYGFSAHKGYGCASHLEAIRQLGPCIVHRLTFGGVREHVPCPSS